MRYLLAVMAITSIDLIAQFLASNRSDGGCLSQLFFYCWLLIYPMIFFKSVTDDSAYHWSYASKPLIESTQQSIADLDLFSLPGYHGVHFESSEDRKFRFKVSLCLFFGLKCVRCKL